MNLKNIFYSLIRGNSIIKLFPLTYMNVGRAFVSSKLFSLIYEKISANNDNTIAECKKTTDFFQTQKSNIDFIADHLKDSKSKDVFSKVISYRCTNKRKYLSSVAQSSFKQYLSSKVVFDSKLFLVDVGACFGESTIDIFTHYKKALKNNLNFKSLIIEPDEQNMRICKRKLKKYNNVIFENYAVGDKEEQIAFSSDLFASSRADKNSSRTVKTTTIDCLCSKHGFEPDYIKFDIEGYEQEALLGAKGTIEKYEPNLAISIYHSDKDMIEIPMYIIDNYDFYDLYVRHYSGFFSDTVLYCVPKG